MEHCLSCNQELPTDEAFYGQHFECFKEIFEVDERVEFHSLARKNFASDPKAFESKNDSPHLTSYFAGNYKKYEGKLGDYSYILKLSKEDYPELAPVEYICNKIAYDCGIRVAVPFTLIDLGRGDLAFVSRNFMYNRNSHANLHAIYHYIKPGSENYCVENIARALFRETRSVQDVTMFFKTLLFDSLIGNHDRHGRNFSLIETNREKRLSPIYDNPSYLGLESGTMLNAYITVHGKVLTKNSKEPSILDYAREIERLNSGNMVKDFLLSIPIKKIQSTVTAACCLSDDMKNALCKMVTEQYQKLEDYVGNK